jgi:hypothetical protein
MRDAGVYVSWGEIECFVNTTAHASCTVTTHCRDLEMVLSGKTGYAYSVVTIHLKLTFISLAYALLTTYYELWKVFIILIH